MRRLIALASLALAVLALAGSAQGGLIQEGNLRVSFSGHLLPRALPRERPAPVTVRLSGSIGTVDGSRPPQLRQISIAVNRAGMVSVAGLPSCPARELQQTSTEAALALCRQALVGHGRFAVNVDVPDSSLIPAHGRVLVFNATTGRRPGLLLHLYGLRPVRATFVLPFKISRRSQGRFGTVFSTSIPRIASDLGYVTDLDLTIGRRYGHAGERRSFLSASCAAPAGFPGAIFELARATFWFNGGQRLTTGLESDCRVSS
jgi:hypothetical protein